MGLAATPGHIAALFQWPMVLSWLADTLTSLVYYFAGMLVAQRPPLGNRSPPRCEGDKMVAGAARCP